MSIEMENKIKRCILSDDKKGITELLNAGLDPNYEGGWPMRLAARHGSCAVVRTLLQYGANPHLLGESGASTLQLAVYSGVHWTSDRWTFLLSCCDSSQLADGAAVAIIFNNIAGLKKILDTGRCNTNLPTTLTGKTVEELAKGYKLQYLLNMPVIHSNRNVTPVSSPRESRTNRGMNQAGLAASPRDSHHRNLSPSVARFFHQTAGQTALTPPQSSHATSPSLSRMKSTAEHRPPPSPSKPPDRKRSASNGSPQPSAFHSSTCNLELCS